ncbi:MAG: NYN domain-containing protein [Microthrixaceae bacterium]
MVDAPLPVRVHFTQAGLEADDRLLEFVESAAPDLGILVVSSDRRVRDGARDRGAGVVSSRTLLALRR